MGCRRCGGKVVLDHKVFFRWVCLSSWSSLLHHIFGPALETLLCFCCFANWSYKKVDLNVEKKYVLDRCQSTPHSHATPFLIPLGHFPNDWTFCHPTPYIWSVPEKNWVWPRAYSNSQKNYFMSSFAKHFSLTLKGTVKRLKIGSFWNLEWDPLSLQWCGCTGGTLLSFQSF